MKSTVRNMMKSALLASALSLAARTPCIAATGNSGNPQILPPQSSAHGKTYSEWVVAWWQWALSIPADRNPLTDTTGEFGIEGQGGSVWFLAGTFGNSADRSYVVPQGKTLFLPVFNWVFGAGAFDCQPSVPGVTCDVPSLIATAAANTEAATVLEVSVDGESVQNVRDYRAASPGPFSINYPDNSVTGLPAGNYFPNVGDGYWLILAPFSPGAHTIQVHVNAPATSNGPIEFTVIWRLTVQ
jgi:hypothetical protein